MGGVQKNFSVRICVLTCAFVVLRTQPDNKPEATGNSSTDRPRHFRVWLLFFFFLTNNLISISSYSVLSSNDRRRSKRCIISKLVTRKKEDFFFVSFPYPSPSSAIR